jgi:thioredoxin reductase
MAVIDTAALRAKYAAERGKRLRPDGNDQYLQLTGRFTGMLDDPYTAWTDREPLRDHVTFAFIGGGFAGLVTSARLREAGISGVRIVEKGGDFGGTWYWNRYPGAMCDTASMIYLPLLEETGHMPSERYAHAPEILEHCQRIAKQYGLYENALFHTRVTGLEWDEPRRRWIVRTDRGDEFTARFVGWGTGPLHVPKLPGIPGIETFAGHAFHTSRWDYDYTGGDPAGAPLDKLGGKRVAIIGTGATAVQCVPHLAAASRELFVFQRTPSSVDVRDNKKIDPEWFAQIATPGWQRRWLENFVANMTPGEWPSEDLVNDGWTDLSKRMRGRVLELSAGSLTPEQVIAEIEATDFEKMGEIRARVNAFAVQLGGGANFVANVPHNLSDSARTVAAVVAHATGEGYDRVEVTRQAQDAWMEQMVSNPAIRSFLTSCTPGYYNNEGGDLSESPLFGGYVHGAASYFRYIEQWRSRGDFAGLEFRRGQT